MKTKIGKNAGIFPVFGNGGGFRSNGKTVHSDSLAECQRNDHLPHGR